MSDLEPGRGALLEEAAPAAPPVVAIVVAHNPGPWFEEVLTSLVGQDYPGLDLLVIDAASGGEGDDAERAAGCDVAARVAAIAPQAYVRGIDANPGYGPAADESMVLVQGAAFFLLCHDDVALQPGTVRALVEEAYRSNGGVVGPKLVAWDDPTRLLDVGLAVDKAGVPAPIAERRELDQEQHDAVRDVFAVPSACMLVRADLFTTLGGFDPGISFFGDDVDLCWRAQVAGARVLVAPGAVARHIEALGERRPVDDRRRLQARHRLRTMLTCYGPWHLARVLPQAAFVAVVEVAYSIIAGRFQQARDVAGAWTWNARHLRDIRMRRHALHALRQVPDREVRRLQVRGSARASAYLRGQIGQGDDRLRTFTTSSRKFVESVRAGQRRTAMVAWALALVVIVVGSRSLIQHGVPAVGDLPRFQHPPSRLLAEWLSGWRNAGVGSESPAPTAFVMLAGAGALFFGATSLLRTLLVVAMLPIGAIGAWRMLRGAGVRARVVSLVVFLAIPLSYNAIANMRWDGLVVWAASPFVLARLGRAAGWAPFVDARATVRSAILGLGLLTAVVAAFVPFFVALVPVVALALAAGSLLAGVTRGAGRMLLVAAGASLVAAVLHLPWTFDFLPPHGEWSAFAGVKSGAPGIGFGAAMRFETGPTGAGPLGWAFLAAAALPLLIGRGWRATWAVRAWTVAVICWVLAWAAGRTGFPIPLPAAEVLLAPAAAAMALSAGLGVAAFDRDLRGFHFGWRQVVSVIAAFGAAIAVVPIVAAMFDGRWNAPPSGFDTAVDFLDSDHATAGPYRVLWLGDPSVLPLSGWKLTDGIAYATTESGTPTMEDRWAGSSDGPTDLIADAIDTASSRQTSRLGRLLAPMGVRYVVVAQSADPFGETHAPVPRTLLDALVGQLDLSPVDVPSSSMLVLQNAAWAPTRATLPAGTVASSGDYLEKAAATDIAGSDVALPDESGYTRASGAVKAGTDVYLGSAASSRWRLEVDGDAAPRRQAFGWASAYAVDSGHATLRYRTSPVRWALLVLEVLLWFWCIRLWRTSRRPVTGKA